MENRDSGFRYRLLSRLQSDCDYYLGNGKDVRNICGQVMKKNKST